MSTAELTVAPSLYEQLGGAAGIATVVDDFYRRVLADDTLSGLFAGKDLAALSRHQTRFIAYALGGPNRYTGRSMRRAHAGLGIIAAQFAAVAGHLRASLASCGVPALLIAQVIEHVAQLEDDIVGQ